MVRFLNKRQVEVLKTLHDHIENYGYAPTLKELTQLLGVKACSTVHEHLENLEAMGYIKRKRRGRRAMRIIKEAYQKAIPIEENKTGVRDLPVLGFIAAGQPIEPHTDPNLYLSIAGSMVNKEKRTFALQVKGDSMIEEGIFEDDYVVIQYQDKVDNGDIVVAILENGLATLKRIFFEDKRIKLAPANSSMQPIYAQDVKIQGKVIAVIRKY